MTDQAGAHTPGPWTKDRYGCLRAPDGKEIITDGLGVGMVFTGNGTAEQKANAHLIASAPAMAEELASLRAQKALLVEALKSIANGDGYYGAQAAEYKAIARAAILAAEGK